MQHAYLQYSGIKIIICFCGEKRRRHVDKRISTISARKHFSNQAPSLIFKWEGISDLFVSLPRPHPSPPWSPDCSTTKFRKLGHLPDCILLPLQLSHSATHKGWFLELPSTTRLLTPSLFSLGPPTVFTASATQPRHHKPSLPPDVANSLNFLPLFSPHHTT